MASSRHHRGITRIKDTKGTLWHQLACISDERSYIICHHCADCRFLVTEQILWISNLIIGNITWGTDNTLRTQWSNIQSTGFLSCSCLLMSATNLVYLYYYWQPIWRGHGFWQPSIKTPKMFPPIIVIYATGFIIKKITPRKRQYLSGLQWTRFPSQNGTEPEIRLKLMDTYTLNSEQPLIPPFHASLVLEN